MASVIADFNYTPFSDITVVQGLIENRSKVVDERDFNETILLTYIDLDLLIDRAKLSASERFAVTKLMEGYTVDSMAECYGKARGTYYGYYSRAVRKIVRQANQEWKEFYETKKH